MIAYETFKIKFCKECIISHSEYRENGFFVSRYDGYAHYNNGYKPYCSMGNPKQYPDVATLNRNLYLIAFKEIDII